MTRLLMLLPWSIAAVAGGATVGVASAGQAWWAVTGTAITITAAADGVTAYRKRQADQELAVLMFLTERPDSTALDVDACLGLGKSPGSLLPVLDRLEREGLVVARWSGDSHPHRRLYRVAPLGGT